MAEARKVAERLCAAVRTLILTHANQTIRISMSFGCTRLNHHASPTLAELLEQADQALYTAKHKGRDRVEEYHGPSHQ
jgi:diguanylate cyclase (GGDEF)-like protein